MISWLRSPDIGEREKSGRFKAALYRISLAVKMSLKKGWLVDIDRARDGSAGGGGHQPPRFEHGWLECLSGPTPNALSCYVPMQSTSYIGNFWNLVNSLEEGGGTTGVLSSTTPLHSATKCRGGSRGRVGGLPPPPRGFPVASQFEHP